MAGLDAAMRSGSWPWTTALTRERNRQVASVGAPAQGQHQGIDKVVGAESALHGGLVVAHQEGVFDRVLCMLGHGQGSLGIVDVHSPVLVYKLRRSRFNLLWVELQVAQQFLSGVCAVMIVVVVVVDTIRR